MSTISAVGTNQTATTGKSIGEISSQDFLNLIIQQLLHQDPLDPMDNQELLSQMTQIRSLESNMQLTQSLQTLVLQQSIASAGDLMGKLITGYDIFGLLTQGVVQGVQISGGKVYLDIGGDIIPIEYVTGIAPQTTEETTNE